MKQMELNGNDLIEAHQTFWDEDVQYIAHYYDVDIGEGVTIRVCEEIFEETENIKYGYFKCWTGGLLNSKMLIHHVYEQPKGFFTKRFQKRVEIVGSGTHRDIRPGDT